MPKDRQQILEASKLGGIAARAIAMERYMENPSICKQCGQIIIPSKNQKPCVAKAKKFCNKSCAATYNNSNKTIKRRSRKNNICPDCGQPIHSQSNKCFSCANKAKTRKDTPERTREGAIVQDIRRHALRVVRHRPKQCAVCGYEKFVENAHIKPIHKFPITATFAEMNALDNLVFLCRNHHWEFDHGVLDISKYISIE